MKLTVAKLNSLNSKTQDKADWINDGNGLYIRISKKGTMTWTVRYRHKGQDKSIKIGRYPHLSLKEARNKAGLIRQDVHDGIDPNEQKRDAAKIEASKKSVSDCFDLFIRENEGHLSSSTLDDYRCTRKHHLNGLLTRKTDEISPREWQEHFMEFNNPKTANFHFKRVRALLNWCYERHFIGRPSILDMKSSKVGQVSKPKERFLSMDEVKLFCDLLAEDSSNYTTKMCVLWVIASGCRVSEATSLAWCDIELVESMWTLPASKIKTREIQLKPLSPLMKDILVAMKNYAASGEWVFPGRQDNHLSRKAISGTIVRICKRMMNENNVQNFSAHDFRRTMATRLAEQRINQPVIEKLLSHALPGLVGVYNKHRYIEEQREAIKTWGEQIRSWVFPTISRQCTQVALA